MDSSHWVSTNMIAIHEGWFIGHRINSVAFWRCTFRRGASREAEGGMICIDRGKSKIGSCTNHTINSLHIMLFWCTGIHGSRFFYCSRI